MRFTQYCTWKWYVRCVPSGSLINPSRPNNDLSQSSHCDIKALSVGEVKRIENMITQMTFY